MRIPIGRDPNAAPVTVDTSQLRALVLVADPGVGKTTSTRFVLRWWIADPARRARVFTERPHEWGDLSVHVEPLEALRRAGACTSRKGLTVVDGADALDAAQLRAHVSEPGLLVLTSYGSVARELEAEPGCLHLGLVGDWDGTQGRLDWPAPITAVVADRRGDTDFPVHRWDGRRAAAGLPADGPALAGGSAR